MGLESFMCLILNSVFINYFSKKISGNGLVGSSIHERKGGAKPTAWTRAELVCPRAKPSIAIPIHSIE